MANPTITEGQLAPLFTIPADDGTDFSLEAARGGWVVFYFYPKDNTSGCTKEACAFQESLEVITGHGASVVGVSPDSVKRHVGFKTKQGLTFQLLADEDHSVATAYGVWRLKKLYGREYEGIVRSTFLIDPEGKIRKVWDKVRVNGHIEVVIAELAALQAEA